VHRRVRRAGTVDRLRCSQRAALRLAATLLVTDATMIEALVVSNLILWVAVLALLGTVVALARQIGILYERVAPMGALMLDNGPKVGDTAPAFDLVTLGGEHFSTGGPRTK